MDATGNVYSTELRRLGLGCGERGRYRDGLHFAPDGNLVIGSMQTDRIALAPVGCPEDVAVGPDGRVDSSHVFTNRIVVLAREPFQVTADGPETRTGLTTRRGAG